MPPSAVLLLPPTSAVPSTRTAVPSSCLLLVTHAAPGRACSRAPCTPGAAADAVSDETRLAFEAPPQAQPLRDDYQNAIKFLSYPKLRGSYVVYGRSFLHNKGITADEIDELFRQVTDLPPTSALTHTLCFLQPVVTIVSAIAPTNHKLLAFKR